MESLELLGGLVEFNLGSLGLSDLFLELRSLACHLDGKFFDLKSEFLDLGLISASVLLESQVVLFLLSGCKRPLLKLFLVPIHLQLELVHFFVGLENHVLDVVKAVLLVGDAVVELLDFVLQTPALSLGDLFHMLLGLDLLVLGIDEGLGVDQLHLDRLEVLGQDLEAFLVLFDLEAELGNESYFFSYLKF